MNRYRTDVSLALALVIVGFSLDSVVLTFAATFTSALLTATRWGTPKSKAGGLVFLFAMWAMAGICSVLFGLVIEERVPAVFKVLSVVTGLGCAAWTVSVLSEAARRWWPATVSA